MLEPARTAVTLPARQQQASERAMRVGCTYWVVMDHHAVQQSGQGVETTYIQTWEGDKNAAHSEPATLLLGCERVEMQREKSLGPSVQNKAAELQESESDWLDMLLKETQTNIQTSAYRRKNPAVSGWFLPKQLEEGLCTFLVLKGLAIPSQDLNPLSQPDPSLALQFSPLPWPSQNTRKASASASDLEQGPEIQLTTVSLTCAFSSQRRACQHSPRWQ